MKNNILTPWFCSLCTLLTIIMVVAGLNAHAQNTLLSNNYVGLQGKQLVFESYAGGEIISLGKHSFVGIDGTIRVSPISGGAASVTPVFGFTNSNENADITVMLGSGGVLVRDGRQDAELVLGSLIIDGLLKIKNDDGLKVRAFTQFTNMRRGSVSLELGPQAFGWSALLGVSNLYRGESFTVSKVIPDGSGVGEIGIRYFAGNAMFGSGEDEMMMDLTGFGLVINMKF